MARNGRDLFERSTMRRVPTAAEVLSGKAKWNEATQSWEFGGKKAVAERPKPVAKKPEEAPKPETGSMTREEIEKVASDFSDPTTDRMGRTEAIRERVREILSKRELPTDSEKWDKGGSRQLNKDGLPKSQEQLVAYKYLRDRGLLTGGEKDLVAQARQFISSVGRRHEEREYQVLIDRDGNRIYAIRGDQSSVGMGTPRDDRGRPLDGFRDARGAGDLRTVTAGATMHHNHPRQGEQGALGMSFSGGDLGNTIRLARGAITATAQEGIYVGRNTKWQEHANLPNESAIMRGRAFAAQIDRASKRIQDSFRAEVRAGRATMSSENFYRYLAPRLHAANIILARKEGIEIDFVPNKGFEWIASEAQQFVNAASSK